jgi:plasmid stability protein
MADILIRGFDAHALRRLKARAKRNGRSLQSEAKLLLEQAAGPGPAEVAAMLEKWRRKLRGRKFDDSVSLIREDRER